MSDAHDLADEAEDIADFAPTGRTRDTLRSAATALRRLAAVETASAGLDPDVLRSAYAIVLSYPARTRGSFRPGMDPAYDERWRAVALFLLATANRLTSAGPPQEARDPVWEASDATARRWIAERKAAHAAVPPPERRCTCWRTKPKGNRRTNPACPEHGTARHDGDL